VAASGDAAPRGDEPANEPESKESAPPSELTLDSRLAAEARVVDANVEDVDAGVVENIESPEPRTAPDEQDAAVAGGAVEKAPDAPLEGVVAAIDTPDTIGSEDDAAAPVDGVADSGTEPAESKTLELAAILPDEKAASSPDTAVANADAGEGVVATGSGLPAQPADAPGEAPAAAMVVFDDLAWLYRQSPESFSIEVLRDADREIVQSASKRLSGNRSARSFSSRVGGELVYNMMVGSFDNLIEVKQALGDLQSAFADIRIRRLGAVQQEWCAELDNLTPEQLLIVVEKCTR
jgi:hypothetical protein